MITGSAAMAKVLRQGIFIAGTEQELGPLVRITE